MPVIDLFEMKRSYGEKWQGVRLAPRVNGKRLAILLSKDIHDRFKAASKTDKLKLCVLFDTDTRRLTVKVALTGFTFNKDKGVDIKHHNFVPKLERAVVIPPEKLEQGADFVSFVWPKAS